jgi:hypothetical protein
VDDLLEVDLPADAQSLRVARLVVWEAATRAGLDCDGADDLCLALDEVCFAIFVRVVPGDRLSLQAGTADGVHLAGRARLASGGHGIVLGDFAQALLAVAVDHFELDERADGVDFTMIKHSPVLELR